MKHYLILTPLLLFLAGCGGGSGTGGTSSGNGWSVSARAFGANSSGPRTTPGVEIKWLLPGSTGSGPWDYEIIRDGSVIASLRGTYFTYDDTGVVPGQSYRYRVRRKHTTPSLDITSPEAGPATPLDRPTAVVTSSQSLGAVGVRFNTVTGADSYVMEFSTKPNFDNKVTAGPFSVPSGTPQVNTTINLTNGFPSLASGQPIYFRVGAANSQDKTPPDSSGSPAGGNYIYSSTPYGSFVKP